MKKIYVAVFAILLTACGGGGSSGGGSDNDGSSNRESSVQTEAVTVNEQGEQTVNVQNASELTAENLPSGVSVQVSNDSITLVTSNVDRPQSYVISFKNKNDEVVLEVELFVNNASAEDTLRQANDSVAQTERISNLTDDEKLYFYIVDILYLQGSITHSEKQSTLDAFSPRTQNSYFSLQSASSSLDQAITDYNNGDISDQSLENSLNSFLSAVAVHSEYGENAISDLQSIYSAGLSDLSLGAISYNELDNVYSRFIGDQNYGSRVNGDWEYNASYDYLSSIVNVDVFGTCAI